MLEKIEECMKITTHCTSSFIIQCMTDEGIFHTVVFASECKRRKTVPCYVPYQYLMSIFCMIKNHLILPWENFDVSHRIVLFDTPQLNSTIYVYIFSIIYFMEIQFALIFKSYSQIFHQN